MDNLENIRCYKEGTLSMTYYPERITVNPLTLFRWHKAGDMTEGLCVI